MNVIFPSPFFLQALCLRSSQVSDFSCSLHLEPTGTGHVQHCLLLWESLQRRGCDCVEHTLELTGQSNAGLVLEGTGSHQLQQPLESCRSKGPVAPPSLVAPATARPEQGHVPAHESPPPGSWGRTRTDCSVRSLTELSLQPAVALAVAQICKAT